MTQKQAEIRETRGCRLIESDNTSVSITRQYSEGKVCACRKWLYQLTSLIQATFGRQSARGPILDSEFLSKLLWSYLPALSSLLFWTLLKMSVYLGLPLNIS